MTCISKDIYLGSLKIQYENATAKIIFTEKYDCRVGGYYAGVWYK